MNVANVSRALIRRLAASVVALLAGACLEPFPAWGDDAMTTTAPIRFYQTKLLEDVSAIAAGEGGYIVTMEHTREPVPSSLQVASEKTIWRFWKFDQDGASVHEASHSSPGLPAAKSVVMTLKKKRLVVLVQVNEPAPAYLLLADAPLPNPPQVAALGKAVQIELDPSDAERIHLNPKDSWNSRGLPPAEWLFHPSLTGLGETEDVALALNTADGHAAVWTANGTGQPKRLSLVPRALNPVLTRGAGKNYLLYRKMPEGWSVFHHDLRYSSQYGPVALPLMISELDARGAIGRSSDYSKDPALGNVLDFAADSAGGQRLAVAVISGSKQAPQLRVYVSDDPSGGLHLRQSVPVRQVPFRLTMSAATGGILIGLAYKDQTGYDVQGMVVPWQ